MNNTTNPASGYVPCPIDTGSIELPAEILELCEKLAENTHENFVKLRMQSGWTWGERRDDALKTNPTLVPYDMLPDSEKEYDRVTSMETLRTIIALGYKISKD